MATPAFTNKSNPLSEKIRFLIQQNGPISFRDYMEMALFDQEFGYYTSDTTRVGKDGDFITSVSVGPCFGLILARRLIAFWEHSGKPGTFSIIEPGAHNGSLCADILGEIQTHCPECFKATRYHLVEPGEEMHKAQKDRLSDNFGAKCKMHHSLDEIRVDHGALISNELIDAFPVELIQFKDGDWSQIYVDECDEELKFTHQTPCDEALVHFCRNLGDQFPDQYLTEYNPGIGSFASEASQALGSGLMITIDYGHEAKDYYHPSRSTGTLQTYYRHQKSDNPLDYPGELDITCHVDFSRLVEEAQSAGFSDPRLSSQSSYLTHNAKDWLVGMEASSGQDQESVALLRQFQTLTHPAMLGTKFMVLEMTKTSGD